VEQSESVDVAPETTSEETLDDKTLARQRLALALGVGAFIAIQTKDEKLKNGDYRNTVEGDYLTEYNYQSMLSSINPLSLNDYGYDGTGINVAVVDSGIDSTHPEFDGKTIQGYDFASSATGFAADEVGHGTHVASIIAGERDGEGMRGVAYDANLFSYKLGTSPGVAITSDASMANIFNRHVTDNIAVSNNSWGVGAAVTRFTSSDIRTQAPLSLTALKAAQDNGTLFVFASGNNADTESNLIGGIPYLVPELKDAWLVVTALDADLDETIYTNRCGVASDFCVSAPGGGTTLEIVNGQYRLADGILAAEANTGGYVRMSGTSMAAPHVSGLAASLMEKFPTLTPAQIATRIKVTSSLSGLTGRNGETLAVDGETVMRAIFGYGLVNSTAASESIGSLVFPTGSTTSGATIIGTSSLSLPSAISGSVSDAILNDKYIVFDTFDGATFTVTGDQLFKSQRSSFTPSYNLHNALPANDGQSKVTQGFTYSFSENGNTMMAPSVWGNKANFFDSAPFVVSTSKHQMGWSTSIDGVHVSTFVNADADDQNTLSFSKLGVSIVIPTTSNLNISVAYSSGDSITDFGYFSNKVTKTNTKDLELGTQFSLSSNERVFARYALTRFDDVNTGSESFGTNNLSADGINLGYEIISTSSAMTLGLKSDSTLVDGSLSMALPVAVDANGVVTAYDERSYAVKARRAFDPYFAYMGKVSGNTNWLISSHLDGDNDYSVGAIRLDISSRF
jgi:subtilase-type serine protease